MHAFPAPVGTSFASSGLALQSTHAGASDVRRPAENRGYLRLSAVICGGRTSESRLICGDAVTRPRSGRSPKCDSCSSSCWASMRRDCDGRGRVTSSPVPNHLELGFRRCNHAWTSVRITPWEDWPPVGGNESQLIGSFRVVVKRDGIGRLHSVGSQSFYCAKPSSPCDTTPARPRSCLHPD